MKKRILVLMGHPDWDTFCGYLASRYVEGAEIGGHEVRRVNIGDLQFDPILHKGYKVIQPLESDLVNLQNDFRWAEHIVIVYPTWWSTMPAQLKGLFDRMFIPSFAYRMQKEGGLFFTIIKWLGGNPQIPLLLGRTGRIITTMDTAPWVLRLLVGNYIGPLKHGLLEFCGIKPVRVTSVGPIGPMDPETRTEWGDRIADLGRMAD